MKWEGVYNAIRQCFLLLAVVNMFSEKRFNDIVEILHENLVVSHQQDCPTTGANLLALVETGSNLATPKEQQAS